MPIMPTRFVPYEMKTSIIKITSYDEKNPQGTLFNAHLGRDIPFHSMTQLLLELDALLSELSCAQPYVEFRTFEEASKPPPGRKETDTLEQAREQAEDMRAALASFQIKVLFRQHASWQGSILWIDQACEAQFRSVLELIRLMDDVLTTPNTGFSSERDQASAG